MIPILRRLGLLSSQTNTYQKELITTFSVAKVVKENNVRVLPLASLVFSRLITLRLPRPPVPADGASVVVVVVAVNLDVLGTEALSFVDLDVDTLDVAVGGTTQGLDRVRSALDKQSIISGLVIAPSVAPRPLASQLVRASP